MAVIAVCEPRHLYNLLNQRVTVSRLAEINYLCLIDAREAQDYNVSHIITAKNVQTNSKGTFLPLENVESDTMENVVVYDSKTTSIDNPGGRALQCAKMVAKSCLCMVYILRGGFEKFSALYPFLRTEQIMYTIKELENIRTYPVEILPQKVYMGNEEQCNNRSVMEDLKIKAAVCISERHIYILNSTVMRIRVGPEVEDTDLSFEEMCNFIDTHITKDSRVLIVSEHGTVRCSAVATAYLMYHFKYTFQRAWKYVQKCKPSISFDRRFTQHMSDWEKKVTGKSNPE